MWQPLNIFCLFYLVHIHALVRRGHAPAAAAAAPRPRAPPSLLLAGRKRHCSGWSRVLPQRLLGRRRCLRHSSMAARAVARPSHGRPLATAPRLVSAAAAPARTNARRAEWVDPVCSFRWNRMNSDRSRIFPLWDEPIPHLPKPNTIKNGSNPTQT